MKMNKRCMHYMGAACIDGTCTIGGAGNCRYCFYYKGCYDCVFVGTDYCEDYQEGLKLDGEDKL